MAPKTEQVDLLAELGEDLERVADALEVLALVAVAKLDADERTALAEVYNDLVRRAWLQRHVR